VRARAVGAIRRFRTGSIKNVEGIVRFEPARSFSYEVRESNIPVRDYRADVTLAPTRDGGTTISWRSSFTARWPLAPIIERRLRTFIADTAQRLVTAAQNGGKVMTTQTPRTIKLRRSESSTRRGPRRSTMTGKTPKDDRARPNLSRPLRRARARGVLTHRGHLPAPPRAPGSRRARRAPATRQPCLAENRNPRPTRQGPPNRLGVSRCQLLAVNGLELRVRGLDAIDGTPMLDIKPHMQEFDPHGPVHQPDWTRELMRNYW
jgi:hypothetical protein